MLDQRFWQKYFRVYDLLNQLIPYRETLADIVNQIDEGKIGNLLDAGCGTGNLILLIAREKEYKKIVGIDFSDVALGIAQEKVFSQGLRDIQFIAANLVKPLPFDDRSFNIIVMNNVLYTIPTEKRRFLIGELRRVLSDKGKVIFSNINKSFKPAKIYTTHIKKSLDRSGFIRTLLQLITYVVPTIKIFFYNYLIKRETESGSYKLLDYGEQKRLLYECGFSSVADEKATYGGNAYLVVARR